MTALDFEAREVIVDIPVVKKIVPPNRIPINLWKYKSPLLAIPTMQADMDARGCALNGIGIDTLILLKHGRNFTIRYMIVMAQHGRVDESLSFVAHWLVEASEAWLLDLRMRTGFLGTRCRQDSLNCKGSVSSASFRGLRYMFGPSPCVLETGDSVRVDCEVLADAGRGLCWEELQKSKLLRQFIINGHDRE